MKAVLTLACIFALGLVTRPLYRSFITSATPDRAFACLEILSSTTTEESGSTYILGYVRNTCDHRVGSITVSFKVDPQSADLPETTIAAYARNLEPGDVKEFKSVVPISRTANFRFDTISAF
jgi:hypothetical protein